VAEPPSRDVVRKQGVEARIGGVPTEESFDGAAPRVLADVRLGDKAVEPATQLV
jgi:hypothetical protein